MELVNLVQPKHQKYKKVNVKNVNLQQDLKG